jgi:CRP-like cAMP-binding protein
MTSSDVVIKKLAQHSELTGPDMAHVRRLTCAIRKLTPGEDFIKQGDFPRASAIVIEGILARYHVLETGHRQYLSIHFPGDWPDAQGLFLEQMDHSVCAIGTAVVCAIPHEELIRLFRERPAAAFAVWRETLIDASIFRETITNNSSRKPLARLSHWFCEMYFRAKQAGLVRRDTMALPLNQAQIGEALGMSLVSVNRTLKQIRRSAAADFKDGALIVKNWMKLSSIGEFDPAYLHPTIQPRR